MPFPIISTLHSWFRVGIDAIFARGIPFSYRWRMFFFLQPITFLVFAVASLPWVFSKPWTVEWLPVSNGRTLRTLVYKRKNKNNNINSGNKLRPLHLDVHAGGFLGGLPEADAHFCSQLAETTGAVVVSTSYRYAPKHRFPAAIDDVDAVLRFLQANATERWGADPELVTVSGFSAGGNLALAATQAENARRPARTAVKGSVTYYAAIDLRLKPQEKPIPTNVNYPKHDPLAVLQPLFDAYACKARTKHYDDPRLSPMLAKVENLPDDMLLIVPAIDILVHEQLTFVQRIKDEIEASEEERARGRQCDAVVFEKGFHGWIELPARIAGPTRQEAIDLGIKFIKEVHEKHGFKWN